MCTCVPLDKDNQKRVTKVMEMYVVSVALLPSHVFEC